MISSILFHAYFAAVAFAIPFSASYKYNSQKNKAIWQQSVFLVVSEYEEKVCVLDDCVPVAQGVGSGTAFVLDHTKETTIFMSAAHVCNEFDISQSDPSLPVVERITSKMYISNEGRLIPAGKMILYKNDITDVCIFGVSGIFGRAIKVAKKQVDYGDEVWTIGAPNGYFPESAKPINKGLYSGSAIRTNQYGKKNDFSGYTLPTVGGMSGSPILDSRGRLIGMVSAVHSEWHLICFSPTHEQILEAIETVSQLLDR